MKRTLQDCFNDAMSGKTETIYYSANTVWWTDDPNDLKKSSKTPIPLDCFGSPLMMTDNKDNILEWLNKNKIINHESYGKKENRERNFMLAHAKNIKTACNLMPLYSFNLVANFEEFGKFCDENIEEDEQRNVGE